MDTDRTLRGQRGQALLELLLLAPLCLALLLATIFFVKALNARLALIQTCRDTALGLARDEADLGPQDMLRSLVQKRGLEGLGRWGAKVEAALPNSDLEPGGAMGSVLGSLVAERLTVSLELPTPRWMPGSTWHLQETVTFKRDPWKLPYGKAIRSLMNPH